MTKEERLNPDRLFSLRKGILDRVVPMGSIPSPEQYKLVDDIMRTAFGVKFIDTETSLILLDANDQQLGVMLKPSLKASTASNHIQEWLDRNFAGHGVAMRRRNDPEIPGEPFMSMEIAKELAKAAYALGRLDNAQDKIYGGEILAKKYQKALEDIALLDEADGHELRWEHASTAIGYATQALGKHPSQIHAERNEDNRYMEEARRAEEIRKATQP
jgi:hypothetical protein